MMAQTVQYNMDDPKWSKIKSPNMALKILFLLDTLYVSKKNQPRYAVTVKIRPGVVPGTAPAPSHSGALELRGEVCHEWQ